MRATLHELAHVAAVFDAGGKNVRITCDADHFETTADLKISDPATAMTCAIAGICSDVLLAVVQRIKIVDSMVPGVLASLWEKDRALFLSPVHAQADKELVESLLRQNPELEDSMQKIIKQLVPVIQNFWERIDVVDMHEQMRTLKPDEKIDIARDPDFKVH